MTRSIAKGVLVAALHLALVGSLGAKLLIDRSSYPRAWVLTGPFDPNLPIRGRYVRLRIEAGIAPDLDMAAGTPAGANGAVPPMGPSTRVRLRVENDEVIAGRGTGDGDLLARRIVREGRTLAALAVPVAFFIPEHVVDPSVRQPGEELWVEVTVPPRGAPRPIRLGVKANGVLTPLGLD